MASLRDIRRRIASVRKTQQITRAMRMVAAAKLRRSQDAIESARPYARYMRATLEAVAASLGNAAEHPLLVPRERVRRLELLVVTSDRGLCGAFNSNVLKYAEALRCEREAQVEEIGYTLLGRKGLEFVRRRRRVVSEGYVALGNVRYGHAEAVAEPLMSRYVAGELDEVVLVYSEFVSALTQRPTEVRLLPFTSEGAAAQEFGPPIHFEPRADRLLALLAPKAIEVEIYRALLESQAGEHAARMTAMESATRNTEEMIDLLTLTYNRARQAAITKELVEIVSGAEAL